MGATRVALPACRRRRYHAPHMVSKAPARSNPPTGGLPPVSKSRARRGPDLLAGVLVAAVAIGGFANSLRNGYVFDDISVIALNPRLDRPWDLHAFFTSDYWGDSTPKSNLYRPLTLWSFALDRLVFGRDPWGIHLTNVLANAAVSVLLYTLVLRLWRQRLLAMLVALLFALHPVHTEAVANGVGRGELLAGLFMLAALHLHLTWVRRRAERAAAGTRRPPTAGPAWPWLCGAVAAYFLAVLCKETAIVLPILCLLMEWLVLKQGGLAQPAAWLAYLAYVPAGAVYAALRLGTLGRSLPAIQEVMIGATATQRVLYASETLLRYIGQLAVPYWLCAEYADYTRPVRSTLADPLVLASLVAWAVLAVLCVLLARRRQFLALFGIGWFFVTILPVSNLVLPIGTIRADRLLYVPSVGFVLILGWLLAMLVRRQRATGLAVATVILGLYGWRTVDRNADWYSQDALWVVTVEQNPGSAVAWLGMGHGHNLKNNYQDAADAYRRAWELRDGAGFFYGDAHYNYAEMRKRLGDWGEAEKHFRLVLQHYPRHSDALVNLGYLLLRDPARGQEAVEICRRAVAEKPAYFGGYANLAQACLRIGDTGAALTAVNQAVALCPDETERAKLMRLQEEIRRRTTAPAPRPAGP